MLLVQHLLMHRRELIGSGDVSGLWLETDRIAAGAPHDVQGAILDADAVLA